MEQKLQLVISAKDQASKQLKTVQKHVQSIDKDLQKSLKTAGLFGAALAGGATIAVKSWLDAAGDFEQTKIAFTTMLGGAEEANKKLAELSSFAAKTPFTLKGVENNARLLMAMGIESDNVIPTLKSLGDVSAGLSVDLERIALNYGQVATQGKLTGVELKDFLRAGVPLLSELAKNLNKTEAEIKEMVSRGEIGFEAVEDAFRSMTGEGGKFANLMEEQSKSFKGQMSNIEDSVELLSREMGAALLPIVKDLASAIQKVVQWFAELSPETKEIIAKVTVAVGVFGALLAVVGLVGAAIPAIVAGFTAVITVLGLLLSPIGLVIAGITALFLAWQNNWLGIRDFTNGVVLWISEFVEEHWREIEEVTQALMDFLKNIWDMTFGILIGLLKGFLQLMMGDFEGAWQTISEATQAFWDGITAILSNIWDTIVSIVAGFKEAIVNAWNGVWQAVSDALTGWIETIKKKVSDMVDAIIAKLNSIKRNADFAAIGLGLKKYESDVLTEHAKTAGGMAKGGVVTKPTLSWIGEGGQNEAVVPLPDGRRIPVQMEGGGAGVTLNFGDVNIGSNVDANNFFAELEGRLTRLMQLQKLNSV